MDDQPAGRGTTLAGRTEGTPQCAFDCQIDIGIFHDDLPVLTAELERHAFQILAANRSDLAANCGRPGERNQLHIFVAHQRGADLFAAAMHEIDDARRHTRLGENFDEASCRVGRIFRRFENDRVAADQRRGNIFQVGIARGKFHGVISAHTPIGMRTDMANLLGTPRA